MINCIQFFINYIKKNILKMKLIKRRFKFKNQVYKVFLDEIREKNNNLIKDYLLIDCINKTKNNEGGVIILPIHKNKVGLMKYHNYIHKKKMYVLPGGFINKNENSKKAAQRELLEETGYKVNISDLVNIGKLAPVPALINANIVFFFTKKLKKLKEIKNDQHEHGSGKITFINISKFKQILKNSSNIDSLTASCGLRFFLYDKKI
tara:strand:- start:23 stop:640 length:618 start_codon:yes stop_codon:yes gene_type:complete